MERGASVLVRDRRVITVRHPRGAATGTPASPGRRCRVRGSSGRRPARRDIAMDIGSRTEPTLPRRPRARSVARLGARALLAGPAPVREGRHEAIAQTGDGGDEARPAVVVLELDA